jgi:hypothetical protein
MRTERDGERGREMERDGEREREREREIKREKRKGECGHDANGPSDGSKHPCYIPLWFARHFDTLRYQHHAFYPEQTSLQTRCHH